MARASLRALQPTLSLSGLRRDRSRLWLQGSAGSQPYHAWVTWDYIQAVDGAIVRETFTPIH